MQPSVSLTSLSGIVPRSEDFFLFCFFWVGFLIFRSYIGRRRAASEAEDGEESGPLPYSRIQDDFANRRFEKVLDDFARLEKHTPEALSLAVNSLVALGRSEDVGTFITNATSSLPHLRSGLKQVVAALAAPTCDNRRQHVISALREVHDSAVDALDAAAVKELLFSLASFGEADRVTSLLPAIEKEGTADLDVRSMLVRGFLGNQNLEVSLVYLKEMLASPSCKKAPPHDLINEVVKCATEAEYNDDSAATSVRPKAWEALDTLKDVKLTKPTMMLFLEWSARQTPVDIAMASSVEQLLRKSSVPLEAYDALVRIHASSSGEESKAVACFDELIYTAAYNGDTVSESCLVGMISSCIEARNVSLAEHIFKWAHSKSLVTVSIFSVTMKVLIAAKEPDRVVAIYESAVNFKNLVFDEALLEQVSECAAEAGRTELAQSLSKEIKKQQRQPGSQNPLSLMRTCVQEGNIDDIMSLLQDLKEQDNIDTVTYNCALDGCVSQKNSEAVKTVLKEMRASNNMDVASYNIMLKQCFCSGASPKAVLEEMRQKGVDANTATFNSLLSCAMTAGDFAAVWKTIDSMENAGQSVDIYTMSILFKGYKRERRGMDAESINRALALISKHSVKIDETLVGIVLEACLALRDVRSLKRALDTIWDTGFNLPKQASLQTYGLMIKAYGQIQGLTEVWQLWTEVTEEKNMEPSEQLYGQMLDVLVGNNSLEDALDIFEQMKKVHKATITSQGFSVAYAMIIRGFTQQKDCERALQCYEEMKHNGTKASLVVFNTLIDACGRVSDMTAASLLFKDMQESSVSPDLITYSTLIKGYCNSDDLEQALYYFGSMQEKGIRPDAIVFNSLLDGCAKKQNPALCEQVIKDMEAAGVVPSNHSASILIKLYGRCKDLDAAFRVVNEMPRKYGFRANAAVYTCLMSACITNGQLEKAMNLRCRMLDEGIYPDERTYSTLLRGALRANNMEQCIMLVDAALDSISKRGGNAHSLLEEDLLRSVLTLTQRQNAWESHGRELSARLQSCGIRVRLPLPPDSCGRNDGFGRQRDYDNGAKRNFGNYREHGKDSRYSTQQQGYQNRRY